MQQSSSIRSVVIVDRIDSSLPKSDRAAVGLAIRELGNDVSVCSPQRDDVALRYALAAGATGLVSLEDSEADVFLFGRGGAGPSGDLRPARLAVSRKINLVLEVLEFSKQADGLHVIRDLGRGSREIVKLAFPVVLVISDNANIPGYVSRYRQMKATTKLPAKAVLETAPSNSLPWQQLRPRPKTADLASKAAGDAKHRMFTAFGLAGDSSSDASGHVISSDPETCASQLVRYLAHFGFIDSRFAGAGTASTNWQDVVPVEPKVETGSRRGEKPVLPPPAGPHSRVPRPLAGPLPGVARRPRPLRPIDSHQARLARRPRPLGQSSSNDLRGPFPVS